MKHWFKFIGWAKISAVAAFVSTIIGVAFQKGMLEKMGFGNMSGNYQIEEIISSAIHVYLMIGNSITELSTWKMLLWHCFGAHRLQTCCCGIDFGHIDLEHVGVALILGTSTWRMLLWH